jgi:signal transduction histidine kinase
MIPILPDQATREQLLGKVRSATGALIERVRQMSLDLRPSLLDEMGLQATLTWLIRNYQEQTRAPVEFHWIGPERRFSPSVEITTYRIIQEALNNVIRHAKEKQVVATIWTDETDLHLCVEDQGGGFDAEKAFGVGKSTGLGGMRERARLLGGDLSIESVLGSGTTISASIPLLKK